MQQSFFDHSPEYFDLPDAKVSYYPNFVPNDEAILQQLVEQVEWRHDEISMYGKSVKIPRLNAWYGDKGANYAYSGLQLSATPWIPVLSKLKTQLEDFLSCQFNSVLANYYRDGQDSVAWHSDDEKELGPEPLIASLSFGASRVFSLKHKFNKQLPVTKIVLESGSLLLMSGKTQHCWQHQVAKTRKETSGRVNLTYRRIV